MILTTTEIDPRFKVTKLDDFIKLPRTVLVNEFNEKAVKKFAEDMNAAENNNDVIPIIIDSYGGEIYSLLAMLDILKSSSKIIATISIGKAMSCGSILLSAGRDGYRYVSPESTIVIHDPSGGAIGKVDDITVSSDEVKRLDSKIYSILDRNCGQSDGYFKKLIHDNNHADWFLSADDCVTHKLANHIRLPRLHIEAKLEVKLL